MPSDKFLIGIIGSVPVDRPDLRKKVEDRIEAALMPLQSDGIYLDSMQLAYGTEEAIRAKVDGRE